MNKSNPLARATTTVQSKPQQSNEHGLLQGRIFFSKVALSGIDFIIWFGFL